MYLPFPRNVIHSGWFSLRHGQIGNPTWFTELEGQGNLFDPGSMALLPVVAISRNWPNN
jgi:hypothetical protein